MDVRKVISPLNASTFSGVTLKVPEGDRPVYFTKTGFLDSEYPVVQSSVGFSNGIANVAAAKAVSNQQILRGDYYGSAGTYDASDLDPRHEKLIATGIVGTQTVNFPSPQAHINYLKSMYGPENVLPGLKFKITFINDTNTNANTLKLNIPVPGGGTGTTAAYGFDAATVPGAYSLLIQGGDTTGKYSRTVDFLVTSVQPGFEAMTYFAQN